ncbi:hypothetical protein [Streptomyces litmocidini]|uniref:hypothetical protein n=1 Tax=Streptomyces litmocidini TaxID=67318 RepID=UPI00167D3D64|nr:hypothetical protein [Streptomyces litmocidini]
MMLVAVVGVAPPTSVLISGLAARRSLDPSLRPLLGEAAITGTRCDRRGKPAAAWFGPKGFACAAASTTAHSSTAVPVSRLFRVDDPAEPGPHLSAESPAATTRLTGRLIGGS